MDDSSTHRSRSPPAFVGSPNREASAKGPAKGPGKGPAKGPAKGKGKSPAQVSQVPGRVEIVILKFVSLHHDVS